jgi:hypothetical protein
MEARKLSLEQIEDLYAFCNEQDVPYYDVQIELVDHLANAIEQKWKENPSLSYDKALWAVFDQFGISGFRKIRRAKEKELRKKYFRLQWKHIAEFFCLPKIILTISLSLIFFTILRATANNLIFGLVFIGLLWPCYLIYKIYIYPRKYRLEVTDGMSFLMVEHQKTLHRSFTQLAYLPINVFTFFSLSGKHFDYSTIGNNAIFEFFMSFLIVFFLIILIVVLFYIPQRIKADFTREFPQFVKS